MRRWTLQGEDLGSWQKYFYRTKSSPCLAYAPFRPRKDTSPRKKLKWGVGLDVGEHVFSATVRGKSQDTLNSWKRSFHSKGLKANSNPF